MKREGFVVILLLLFIPAVSGFAGERFLIFFTGNYLIPSDGNYKSIYGSGILYPELIIGSEIRKNLSLWAGFGLVSVKGTNPEPRVERKSTQKFLSFGTRYSGKVSRNVVYKVDFGLCFVVYKQDALQEELSGSALGFRTDFGFVYSLTRSLFTEFSVGYLSASDRVKGYDIRWGGITGGVGLGIRF